MRLLNHLAHFLLRWRECLIHLGWTNEHRSTWRVLHLDCVSKVTGGCRVLYDCGGKWTQPREIWELLPSSSCASKPTCITINARPCREAFWCDKHDLVDSCLAGSNGWVVPSFYCIVDGQLLIWHNPQKTSDADSWFRNGSHLHSALKIHN